MSKQSTATGDAQLFRLPANSIGYVAVLAALASAVIHLLLAPQVMEFSQTTGILFYLNGAGWIGGILLFFSRFWRRELYLVAAGYALVTLVAFFAMGGRLNTMAMLSKGVEAVVVFATVYLYTAEPSGP
ncbi:DUF7475 family protein (plasmid) [Haloarcula salina]|uniref:DUF7475 family protein n=1 Tax=Haloarcula salina TaxID=1429914 RepID=UPI003C6FDF03